MQILGGPFLPPEDDVVVFETVHSTDVVSVAPEINKKLNRDVDETVEFDHS